MPHLWHIPEASDRWHVAPLDAGRVFLPLLRAEPAVNANRPVATIRRVPGAGADPERWVLIAERGSGVTVNGVQLALGVRVLRDRDEIMHQSARWFFSAERLARVEAFPGAAGSVFCARCRQAVEPGSPTVRCPGCGTWYHQSESLGCWVYGEKCALCVQATALDAGFRWEPEF